MLSSCSGLLMYIPDNSARIKYQQNAKIGALRLLSLRFQIQCVLSLSLPPLPFSPLPLSLSLPPLSLPLSGKKTIMCLRFYFILLQTLKIYFNNFNPRLVRKYEVFYNNKTETMKEFLCEKEVVVHSCMFVVWLHR